MHRVFHCSNSVSHVSSMFYVSRCRNLSLLASNKKTHKYVFSYQLVECGQGVKPHTPSVLLWSYKVSYQYSKRCNRWLVVSNENGSDTNGYHRYHICFHICGRIRIRIRIISTMSDKIELDVDTINIRFKYSNIDTVPDVE